jgi:hypothetical protein
MQGTEYLYENYILNLYDNCLQRDTLTSWDSEIYICLLILWNIYAVLKEGTR